MKIMFIMAFPNPFPGASWSRIGFFADSWSKQGNSVDILGGFGYGSFNKRGKQEFGHAKILNLIFTIGLRNSVFSMINNSISLLVTYLVLLAKKPERTIISVPMGGAELGAIMACKLSRTKYVVDYRDEWEDYSIYLSKSRIDKFFFSIVKSCALSLYNKSQLVVAVTPNLIEALRRRGLENLALITNGADVRTFRPLKKEKKEAFTLFYTVGIGGYHPLDFVVKSIVYIKKKIDNIVLKVAGTGNVEQLLTLAAELGVRKNVIYEGEIFEREKLAEFIAEADVGLVPLDDNPLWNNAFPVEFFEYCSCGIPIVATVFDNSLLGLLIKKYELGLVSPPLNVEKLAEAIYRIYSNDPFRKAAGKSARTFVEQKFDRNKLAEDFRCLIFSL